MKHLLAAQVPWALNMALMAYLTPFPRGPEMAISCTHRSGGASILLQRDESGTTGTLRRLRQSRHDL